MPVDSRGGLGTTPPTEFGDEPSPDPDDAEGHQAPRAPIGLWIVVAAVIAASAIIAFVVF